MALTDLFLYSNALQGIIPSAIGRLAQLQQLWLQHNQLAGSLPMALGDLSALTDLFLYSNALQGIISSPAPSAEWPSCRSSSSSTTSSRAACLWRWATQQR